MGNGVPGHFSNVPQNDSDAARNQQLVSLSTLGLLLVLVVFGFHIRTANGGGQQIGTLGGLAPLPSAAAGWLSAWDRPAWEWSRMAGVGLADSRTPRGGGGPLKVAKPKTLNVTLQYL